MVESRYTQWNFPKPFIYFRSESSNTLEIVESRYSQTWCMSWYGTVRVYNKISPICQKAFIPARILEETESILLNLGKCSKPKDTHKPRMQNRGDKEKLSQKESTHCKMCVINVRSLVISIYSCCWSQPPCPNLIGSVNLNWYRGQEKESRQGPGS